MLRHAYPLLMVAIGCILTLALLCLRPNRHESVLRRAVLRGAVQLQLHPERVPVHRARAMCVPTPLTSLRWSRNSSACTCMQSGGLRPVVTQAGYIRYESRYLNVSPGETRPCAPPRMTAARLVCA